MSKEGLKMEDLAKQDELTEEQQKQIHDTAYAEEEKEDNLLQPTEEDEEKEGQESDSEEKSEEQKSGEEKVEKSEEDLLNAKEEELTDDEKAKRQEILDTRAEEEAKLLKTSDDELDEEQKARKAELLEAKEEGKEQDFEQRVKNYATQNKIPEEDAKKELKQIDEIKTRYDGDIEKVSKSNLYLQRMASKTQNELKKMQEVSEQKEITPEQLTKSVENGTFIVPLKDGAKKAFSKQDLIQIGRTNKEWADIADSMEDEQLYKIVIKDIAKKKNETIKANRDKVLQEAATKRVEAIKELANYDNKFYEKSKGIIENISDKFLVNPNFDVKNVLEQVKGERYDQDIKEAEDRGYKRGLEKAKVLEQKPPVGEARGKKATPPSKAGSLLNEAQKLEALNMFESADVPDEKKFEMYLNVNPSLKKKKKEK